MSFLTNRRNQDLRGLFVLRSSTSPSNLPEKKKQEKFNCSLLCLSLPTAHHAVQDSRRAEIVQQVIHHVVILLVLLHHTVVGWNKGPQRVFHQPEVALLLPLTELLQHCAIIPDTKVTYKETNNHIYSITVDICTPE